MPRKSMRVVFTALAVLSVAGAAGTASAQDDEPTQPQPKEYRLLINPLTGHIYCITEGSGCIVGG
jgi:hypothetical protein